MDQLTSVTRPWYRLHRATIALLIGVGVAVTYSQFSPQICLEGGTLSNFSRVYWYGWPRLAVVRTDHESLAVNWIPGKNLPAYEVVGREFTIDNFPLILDVAASILLVASTAIASEQWQRRRIRFWQCSLGDLLMFTTVAGALIALYGTQTTGILPGEDWWSTLVLIPAWPDDVRGEPWFIAVPILIGVACTIYVFASVLVWTSGRVKRMVQR